MGKIRTIEIRDNCKECGKPLPNARYRTFCSKECRRKDENRRRARLGYHTKYNRKRYSQYAPGKIQCEICGGWYRKLGAHVAQRHGMTAREYRKEYGLDVKTGNKRMVNPEHHEHLSNLDQGEHIEKNLAKGAKYRFKPGDKRAGNYERSPETVKRVSELGKRTGAENIKKALKKRGILTSYTH